ncbi:MAG: type II toxin-antitoxin system RelE/ParE family toxin [Paludibacter sp.]
MSKSIIWSPLAENDLEKVLDYLDEKWNKKVALGFLDKIENLTSQICVNPKQFQIINTQKKILKCVVTKHNTIFYRERKKND